MKTFKEWLKIFIKNHRPFYGFSPSAGIGWKACLEEVLKLNSVRIHDDVYTDIQKALEEINEIIL